MGRRVADEAIRQGRVSVNNSVAHLGQEINLDDTVTLDNRDIIDLRIIVGSQSELYPAKTVLPEGRIALATSRDEKPFTVDRIRSGNGGVLHKSSTPNVKYQTILLNKPVGYVCSRNSQGNQTIYNLLPANLHHLKPVGRLDKNSSGLLLLTNDGQLAYELTHPKFEKIKKYKIALNKDLGQADFQKITQQGVLLEDGLSTLALDLINNQRKEWKVIMQEGRNRQIRRTFEHLGYRVIKLHRTHFGPYKLGLLSSGNYQAAN
ncbi:rRNA pseudouridine synthase [Candidatus Saccharibacteria bacterium]|nr:rRNA pseudouridine synthase [Candidatus Saccharibacteria bacterium]MBI3338305.1 rRNA pseudouridine synthase [Candidatus Saccharibacteria bacterium]